MKPLHTLVFLLGIFLAALLLIANFNHLTTTNNSIMALDEDTIVLPVKLHLLRDAENMQTTLRNQENVRNIFVQVNRIWEPAKIYFKVKQIVYDDIQADAVFDSINADRTILPAVTSFDNRVINIYFAKTIGANGIAISPYALIADITSVNDFRATSHELGHLLGLGHDGINRTRLMYQGVNGETLTETEIAIAQENARILKTRFQN
jgi:hypothetical protein